MTSTAPTAPTALDRIAEIVQAMHDDLGFEVDVRVNGVHIDIYGPAGQVHWIVNKRRTGRADVLGTHGFQRPLIRPVSINAPAEKIVGFIAAAFGFDLANPGEE